MCVVHNAQHTHICALHTTCGVRYNSITYNTRMMHNTRIFVPYDTYGYQTRSPHLERRISFAAILGLFCGYIVYIVIRQGVLI